MTTLTRAMVSRSQRRRFNQGVHIWLLVLRRWRSAAWRRMMLRPRRSERAGEQEVKGQLLLRPGLSLST